MVFRFVSLVAILFATAHSKHISSRSNPVIAEYQPYQVFIVCPGPDSIFGSGVSVTNRHILTTASLLKGCDEWKIGYGSNVLSKLVYTDSKSAFIHPNYNEFTRDYNVGIVVLNLALPTYVQQIALPTVRDAALPRLNEEGTIVGFGQLRDSQKVTPNDFLKTAYLLALSKAQCSTAMPDLNPDLSFCAKDDLPNSVNLCKGDSGSAFVISYRGKKMLAGISSIISNTCKSSEPIAFVRMQAFSSWINDVTAFRNYTSIF